MENEQRQSQQTLLSCEDSKGIEANFEMVFNIIGEVAEEVDVYKDRIEINGDGFKFYSEDGSLLMDLYDNYLEIYDKNENSILNLSLENSDLTLYSKNTNQLVNIYDGGGSFTIEEEGNELDIFGYGSDSFYINLSSGEGENYNAFTISKYQYNGETYSNAEMFAYVKKCTIDFTLENNKINLEFTFLSRNGNTETDENIPLYLDFKPTYPVYYSVNNIYSFITNVKFIKNSEIEVELLHYDASTHTFDSGTTIISPTSYGLTLVSVCPFGQV